MNKKLFLVLVPVFLLLVLGGVNIYRKIIWQEPTDGVSWEKKGGALAVAKVEASSNAAKIQFTTVTSLALSAALQE